MKARFLGWRRSRQTVSEDSLDGGLPLTIAWFGNKSHQLVRFRSRLVFVVYRRTGSLQHDWQRVWAARGSARVKALGRWLLRGIVLKTGLYKSIKFSFVWDHVYIEYFCRKHQIPHRVWSPRRLDSLAQELRATAPDFVVSAGFPRLLPPDVLGAARHCALNVHAGPLPTYRGAHVVFWQVLNGEPEIVITVHEMTTGLDEGRIMAERRLPVDPQAIEAGTFLQEIDRASFALLADTVAALERNAVIPRPQEGPARVYPWPRAEVCEIAQGDTPAMKRRKTLAFRLLP